MKATAIQTRRLTIGLPQTDRASAFVVDRVKIFITSSSITIQIVVIVISYTVCAHVPKIWCWALPHPLNGSVANPLKHAIPPYLCYHQISSLYVNRLGVCWGYQNFVDAETGHI